MAISKKKHNLLDILHIDSKIYKLRTQPLHPRLVAFLHLMRKTKSQDICKDYKMTCNQIDIFIDRVDEYKATFVGRNLKWSNAQEKMLHYMRDFASKNRFTR